MYEKLLMLPESQEACAAAAAAIGSGTGLLECFAMILLQRVRSSLLSKIKSMLWREEDPDTPSTTWSTAH